jgi:molybdopterin converting factor small subunit
MNVLIPSPLRSYTARRVVEADGPTLGAVLEDLDRQFPGIRFRMINEQDGMRPHVRFFVGGKQVFELSQALRSTDELVIDASESGRRDQPGIACKTSATGP